ncbi:MAG: D-alanyl-D-alanine carboxypeptidase [Hydrogenophilales bacterium]|nr:D-alanyl-D-alanine carboxypeptidase [Hydrogenophilales bacterium]
MNKCISIVVASCFAVLAHAAPFSPPAPQIEARAWLLIDAQSGAVLAQRDPDRKIEPASLTKLMTAYLTFGALKEGRLQLGQTLQVSEKAWKAEGSRMFLDPRKPAVVEDLIKGMIVQSGNDACITLAEGIAGSEAAFAALMNQTAQRLGMRASHFVNATGLPDAQHYTTARDLATLALALIRDFPSDYKYYAIKEFTHAGITQPNRNRLLWLDPNVDGVKTGHTESAGYCLIASSRRDNRRLLSVVLGTASDAARATESQKLLNYGLQFHETVRLYTANQPVSVFRIYKGKGSELGVGFTQDFHVTVPRGSASRIKAEVIARQPLLAPATRGQAMATLRLKLDDQILAEYPMVALQTIPVASLIGRLWDGLMLLFKGI